MVTFRGGRRRRSTTSFTLASCNRGCSYLGDAQTQECDYGTKFMRRVLLWLLLMLDTLEV